MRLSLSPFTSKVAFGAKRTSTGRQNRLDRSKMTPSDRSPFGLRRGRLSRSRES